MAPQTSNQFSVGEPVLPGIDDANLMAGIASKEDRSLNTLYDRYSGVIFAMCLRALPRAEAEEVVVDVFWELWERSARYDSSRGSPAAYLIGVARSRILDKLRAMGARKRQVAPAIDLQTADPSLAGPLHDATVAEQRNRVAAALSQLPAPQRQLLELAFFDALSHSEIAAQLAVPLGTVKSRIRQGLSRLRDVLGEQAVEETGPQSGVLEAAYVCKDILVKCETYQDLIPQYLLDDLSAQDRELLRAHLQSGCPKCAGALAEAEALINLMPLAISPVTPPAAVRERLMARINQSASSAPAQTSGASDHSPTISDFVAPSTAKTKSRRTTSVPWAVAAAASIAALALGLWGAQQAQTARSLRRDAVAQQAIVQSLEAQKTENDSTVQGLRNVLKSQEDRIRRMRAPDVQVASLQGTPAQSHAGGRLFLDPKSHTIDFAVAGLSPPPPGKTYELWLVTQDQKKLPIGTFNVNAEGEGFLEATTPTTAVALFAVTDEPGFVQSPTGKFQLLGKIDATP